ncbi:hypothetical protein LRP49_11475 [Enterovibrio sp. ZSDZ35]|uniref:Uncharacterized protein n=1 Tax=Enterovibrio qingdaonensis TaxID=2899818 RepID=A0ABT5QLG6_9GAMM|nr:hypothetical protein [Enterovibrio sp. ZSDZ35]MDD1781811.1 hypothetical protein [Enterovibrio sp. ZSDZ35]
MRVNAKAYTRSAIAIALTSLLFGCGGSDGNSDTDSGDGNIPDISQNCLMLSEGKTCFDASINVVKGNSFTIQPISGNGDVNWYAPNAFAIENGAQTYFSYDAAFVDSTAKIYAVDPNNKDQRVEISVALASPSQELNIYPPHFAVQSTNTEMYVEWLPITSKASEIVDLPTVIEVTELDSNGNPISTTEYAAGADAFMTIDTQPETSYQIHVVVKGDQEYRSLPLSVTTSHVDYRERSVTPVDNITDVPALPVGSLVDFNDELYMVHESASGALSYVPAHPFQLLEADIPEFSTVLNDLDASTIVALSKLAEENVALMRVDGESAPSVRFEENELVINSLIIPRDVSLYARNGKATSCENAGPIKACANVRNKTNFIPVISTEHSDNKFTVTASVGIDAGIDTTLTASQKISGKFDPIGMSRSVKFKYPKFENLEVLNKYTKGQTVDIGVTVGFRGKASIASPEIGFGMKNAVYAKMSASAGATFKWGIIPKPFFEEPIAKIQANIAQPYYGDSYLSVKDSLKIGTQLDIGVYAKVKLMKGFDISLNAYERGNLDIEYTSPVESLIGLQDPLPFLLHTNAADMGAVSKVDGGVKFSLLDLNESFNFDFGQYDIYSLPTQTAVDIHMTSLCLEKSRYNPDMSQFPNPEDANIHTPDSGWLFPGDMYGSNKHLTFTPVFRDVAPSAMAFVNSNSPSHIGFIDKINTTQQETRGVYRLVKKDGFGAINAAFPMIADVRIIHSEIQTPYPWVCWGKSFEESKEKMTTMHTLNNVVMDLNTLGDD